MNQESGGDFSHFAVFPNNKGKAETAVLGAEFAGSTAKRTFSSLHELRRLRLLSVFLATVLAHTPINFSTL